MTYMPCPACWGRKRVCEYCEGSGDVEDVQLSTHFRSDGRDWMHARGIA